MTVVGCGCHVETVVPRTGFTPYVGAATAVRTGGESVVALYGPLAGGRIYNPATTAEQGIAPVVQTANLEIKRRIGRINTYGPAQLPTLARLVGRQSYVDTVVYGPPEPLYFSVTGPAEITVVTVVLGSDVSGDFDAGDTGPTSTSVTTVVLRGPTTFELLPGETFVVPANLNGDVSVTAQTSGHRFSAIAVQPVTQYPPTPYSGAFPPAGPTSKTETIPSYLYQEYSDDDDLQALVDAHNQVTQAFVDSFNALNLPDYTRQGGQLLDWVGQGLYGLKRPTLYSGRSLTRGPLNTYRPAQRPHLNGTRRIGIYADVAVTSDDVYKRILTWHLYRGDGRQVTTEWLKRRVLRFLFGTGGADFEGSDPRVSVILTPVQQLTVTIISGYRMVTKGPLNTQRFGRAYINGVASRLATNPVPALSLVLQEAIATGAVETPTQYQVTCRIGIVGTAPNG